MERTASVSAVRVSGLFLLFAVHGSGYAEASVSAGALQDVSSALTRLSPTLLFDSAEHPDAAVSEFGTLSRGLILSEERIVLLDGRALLFINPWTDELWTAGGEGGGPGEFAGSGLEIAWFRKQYGLTAWDLNNDFRLTEFSDEGDVLSTRRLDLSHVEFEHWTAVSALGAVFDDGGLLFLDGGYSVAHDAGGRFRKYVVEVGTDGGRRTIAEFAGEEGSTVLFGHSTVVSVGGERIAISDTASDEIRILDRTGSITSRLPMPGQRVRVSRYHLEAAREEAQARARSSHENMVGQLHTIGRSTEGLAFREREYRHNDIAPPIDRTQFDRDGRLWIRHYRLPGNDKKRWTVWDGDKTFSVDLSDGESLLDACGDLLLLRIRSGLGVDRAVIRELDRGTEGTPCALISAKSAPHR